MNAAIDQPASAEIAAIMDPARARCRGAAAAVLALAGTATKNRALARHAPSRCGPTRPSC